MIAIVVHLLVIPIANVDGAVRADLDVHRPKPAIGARHGTGNVAGAKGGSVGNNVALHDPALHGFDPEQFAGVGRGQRPMIVNDEIVGETRFAAMRHGREVAIGIGIGERAVLLKTLLQITALYIMKPAGVTAIVPGENSSLTVDLAAERVAAALGEDLVNPFLRVIAPDVLSL